jgi:hypothetical protein
MRMRRRPGLSHGRMRGAACRRHGVRARRARGARGVLISVLPYGRTPRRRVGPLRGGGMVGSCRVQRARATGRRKRASVVRFSRCHLPSLHPQGDRGLHRTGRLPSREPSGPCRVPTGRHVRVARPCPRRRGRLGGVGSWNRRRTRLGGALPTSCSTARALRRSGRRPMGSRHSRRREAAGRGRERPQRQGRRNRSGGRTSVGGRRNFRDAVDHGAARALARARRRIERCVRRSPRSVRDPRPLSETREARCRDRVIRLNPQPGHTRRAEQRLG